MTVLPIDLCDITRDGSKLTTVKVQLGSSVHELTPWLRFGPCTLRWGEFGYVSTLHTWLSDATDARHRSQPHALSLDLVGLELAHHRDLVVEGRVTFGAFIEPHNPDGLRVPPPDYNPAAHPDAVRCDWPECLARFPKGHVIVPREFESPPVSTLALFHLVRGRRVFITIGNHGDER